MKKLFDPTIYYGNEFKIEPSFLQKPPSERKFAINFQRKDAENTLAKNLKYEIRFSSDNKNGYLSWYYSPHEMQTMKEIECKNPEKISCLGCMRPYFLLGRYISQ